jgi:hypothetical protein
MRRFFIWILLPAITLAVAVWQAPASLIALFLSAETARVVQVHTLNGTLWRGSTLLSVTGVPPSLSVAWQCRPSLSALGLHCELSQSLAGVFTVDLVASKIRADAVTATLPIHVVAAGTTLAASPKVVADFSEIVAAKNMLALKGNVRASDASYRLGNSATALGELTLDCLPAADAVSSNCTVSNRGGGARLDGKLLLTPSKASGELVLTPSGGPAQRIAF